MRQWDSFTIQHEPISPIDLMERAAFKCVEWIINNGYSSSRFSIICGKGNNGGDGLAIARLLANNGNPVSVYIAETGWAGTEEFHINLDRLKACNVAVHFIYSSKDFPELSKGSVIIDGLFGTGLSREPDGLIEALIKYMNQSGTIVLSIDLPSGLFPDRSTSGPTVVHAVHTLCFQAYKTGLLLAENAPYTGQIHVLDIGLHPGYYKIGESAYQLLEKSAVKKLYKPRSKFSHKGHFGHSLLIGGCFGKMGALVLAVSACIRSGSGLTTSYLPHCGYLVMQTAIPEAMVHSDHESDYISDLKIDPDKYTAIGIGPGMGTHTKTQQALRAILSKIKKPLVLDADALNCLATHPDMLSHLPANSILTPHPKEFERLFGHQENDFERIQAASRNAEEYQLIIVLKGHHTFIALPNGKGYFNATGNPGLAKGGSGDVLTGMVTAFLAQGYDPVHAAFLGVYLHGSAADIAIHSIATESLAATDVINCISAAFISLYE